MSNDGTESKYLAGHISKAIIDEKFMNDGDKAVDSTLAINCKDHDRPAIFFSQKFNSYRCFKCMLEQEGLVYVDKQYKHDMEEFEGIKRLCHRIVTENTPNSTLISSWKREIRRVLV